MDEIPMRCPLVYVTFSAEINAYTTESLISVMSACANRRAQQVHLLLSTPGGSVMNGMNLYHLLCGMPFELTTHNVGNVDSIGNAVFLAGRHRFATHHATFMFHGVGMDLNGHVRLEEKNLREQLDAILNDHKRIGEVLCKHTRLTAGEAEGLFREAQTKDVGFAIDKGIIHEIRDVQLTAGVPVISLVFKR